MLKNRDFKFKNQKNSIIFIKFIININKKLVSIKLSVNFLIINYVNILKKFKFIILKKLFIKFKNKTFVTSIIKINKKLVFIELLIYVKLN